MQKQTPRTIILNAHPSDPERLGAEELKKHAGLVGVKMEIIHETTAPAIYVGKSFLPKEAGKSLKNIRYDGFILYRRKNNVYIAGRVSRGTLFGCYKYLESLGIRWPEPGVPAERTNRTFALADNPDDGIDNPDFQVRGANGYCPTNDRDFKITLEIVEWLARHRYNFFSFLRQDLPALMDFDDRWFKLADFVHKRGLEFALGSHLLWSGFLTYQDRFLYNKHPEYFPLRNGKRQPSGLFGPQEPGTYGPHTIAAKTGSGMSVCVSNPKVIDLIVKNLQIFLDEHPEIDVMGLWPPDTKWEGCECPKCRRLVRPERLWSNVPYHKHQWRATSDHLVHLLGRVAARIKKSHPKRRIWTWAWCPCEPAPQNVIPEGKLQLEHFYQPCFTHAMNSTDCLHHHIHPHAWRQWVKMKNTDFGWNYTGAAWAMTCAEFPQAWLIKKNIDFLKSIGGKTVIQTLEIGGREDGSLRGDTTDHYLFCSCGVNYYVLGRTAWNGKTPLQDLYADYAEMRFGSKAAPLMTQYYTQIVDRYESWQHSQPLPDFTDIWGSSEVRCRSPWEAVVDIFTPEMMDHVRRLLDQAEVRTKKVHYKIRIQLERRVFEHTILMKKIFNLHLARQKLDEIGDTKGSQTLRQKQVNIIRQAEEIPLPKHFNRDWLETTWINKETI